MPVAPRIRASLLLALAVFGGSPEPARADQQAAIPTLAVQPSLWRTSRVQLHVERGLHAQLRIGELAKSLGGQIANSSEQYASVEVPTARYAAFIAALRRLGKLSRETVTTSDESGRLSDAQSLVRSLLVARERRARLGAIARSVNEKLTLEGVNARTANAIVQAQRRVHDIESRSEIVKVEISLRTEGVETIEPATLPFGWLDELGAARLANPPAERSDRSLELRAMNDFQLNLKTDYVHDAEPLGGTHFATALAFDMRVLGEANPVGIFGGLDLGLGASQGFVYNVQSLIGAGVPIGQRLVIGVSSGPGIDGITTVVPFGLLFPVELYVGWDMAEWMSVSVWAHNAWVVASDARQAGSPNTLFGDELSAGLALVLAARDSGGTYSSRRNGWVVGAGYRELMGTQMFELRLGWAGIQSDFSGGY